MATGTIDFTLVTPERALVHERVEELQIPGAEGYLGILPGHAPLFSELKVGELGYRIGERWFWLSVAWGFVEVLPDQVTLVPELPGEVTTTGGLDCTKNLQTIAGAIERLKSAGMVVSLFIDPEEEQIRAADDLGATAIELNTSRYSDATLTNRPVAAASEELAAVRRAAEFGVARNLQVLAGHGLTYRNVRAISRVEQIIELNIGHNIIARAALVGLDRAVRDMLALL